MPLGSPGALTARLALGTVRHASYEHAPPAADCPPESLAEAMAKRLAVNDAGLFVAAAFINASVLPGHLGTRRERVIMAAVALHCLLAWYATRQAGYSRPGRLRAVVTLSVHAATLALPLCLSTVTLIAGAPPATPSAPPAAPAAVAALGGGAAAAVAAAAEVAAVVRALVLFALSITWLQMMGLAALGWPQTPVVALCLQAAKAAVLMSRAPAGAHLALAAWGCACLALPAACAHAGPALRPHPPPLQHATSI